jgi:hypothetical protein
MQTDRHIETGQVLHIFISRAPKINQQNGSHAHGGDTYEALQHQL